MSSLMEKGVYTGTPSEAGLTEGGASEAASNFRSNLSQNKKKSVAATSVYSNPLNHKKSLNDQELVLAGYCIAKWKKTNEVAEKIKAIVVEYEAEAAELEKIEAEVGKDNVLKGGIKSMGSLLARGNEKDLVHDYWEKTNNDDSDDIYNDPKSRKAIAVLQAVVQSWIELSAMRKNKAFTGHSMESKTQTVQNCIRRYLASKKVTSRETVEKEHRILFTKFCSRTMKGITLKMFSRKHGTVVERLLAFDSDCKSIVYPTNSYGSFGEILIKDIYHVQRGMSGELYPLATVGAKNNTFHLALLGGRYIDLEALSTADAKLFFFGFSRLRTLANSRSPFYIDKNGIPSRAVSSIIRTSLEEGVNQALTAAETTKFKGCTSEADLMRFRAAVKGLAREYNSWNMQRNKEERDWKVARRDATLLGMVAAGVEGTKAAGTGRNRDEEHLVGDDSDSDSDGSDYGEDGVVHEKAYNGDLVGKYNESGQPGTAHRKSVLNSERDVESVMDDDLYIDLMRSNTQNQSSGSSGSEGGIHDDEGPATYAVPQLEGMAHMDGSGIEVIENYLPDSSIIPVRGPANFNSNYEDPNNENENDDNGSIAASDMTSASVAEARRNFNARMQSLDQEEQVRVEVEAEKRKEEDLNRAEEKALKDFWHWEPRIRGIYESYNPDKVNEVPLIMKHFQGREKDLFVALKEKYDIPDDHFGPHAHEEGEEGFSVVKSGLLSEGEGDGGTCSSGSESGDEPIY